MLTRRLPTVSFAVLLALLSVTHAQPGTGRDWTKAPAIAEATAAQRLIAIGDTHGDFERAAELLAKTGVIAAVPSSGTGARWAAGNATLVCTGDFIDKYTSSLEVIALFRTIQEQAPASGGLVVVTLGNHEAEFLAGNGKNRKAALFEEELKKVGISAEDVAAGRDALGIGAWLRNLPAGVRVGSWFFCHAGDTGGLTLAELSEQIQKGVDADGFATPVLVGPTSLLEARLHPHPWWEDANRPKAHGKKHKEEGGAAGAVALASEIAALGVKHLVQGHQPEKVKFADKTERPKDVMFSKFDGALFLIDCGMSRGVHGAVGAILDIDMAKGSATARYADGHEVVLLE